MERAAWTDERLDDLIEGMRHGFSRVDQDVRDLRSESRSGFAAVRTEMRSEFTAVRAEMQGGFATLREEINELRRVMVGVGGGIILALIGVIASILAVGV